MDRKRIAIIFGGNSTEYEVSLQSAYSVLENINADKFDIFQVGITRSGDWYHYTGKREKISSNTWFQDYENMFPVVVSQSRSRKGFLEFVGESCRVINADLVFPVLHGKNGEDGTLQGMFELAESLLWVVIRFRQQSAWIRSGRISWSALRVYLFQNQ